MNDCAGAGEPAHRSAAAAPNRGRPAQRHSTISVDTCSQKLRIAIAVRMHGHCLLSSF